MKLTRAFGTLIFAAGLYAGRSAARAVARERTGAAPGPAAVAANPTGATAAQRSTEVSWGEVGKRVFFRIGDDRVLAEAASVTYYTLLAMFPALAALISLYGLVADPRTIANDLQAIRDVVPGGGMDIINTQVHSLISAPQKALGFGALFGLLTSIWSATAGVKSLFDALNAVNRVRETRSFMHLTWLSLAFTAGALGLIIVATVAVVVVPAVLAYVGFASLGTALLAIARWPVLLCVFLAFLALIYRYGPSHVRIAWHWLSWGSFFAAITWIGASLGFSWYVANFGSYNKTYGSLGAVVGFMTWIWISTIIVLTGAEINAEIARQR